MFLAARSLWIHWRAKREVRSQTITKSTLQTKVLTYLAGGEELHAFSHLEAVADKVFHCQVVIIWAVCHHRNTFWLLYFNSERAATGVCFRFIVTFLHVQVATRCSSGADGSSSADVQLGDSTQAQISFLNMLLSGGPPLAVQTLPLWTRTHMLNAEQPGCQHNTCSRCWLCTLTLYGLYSPRLPLR